MALNTKRDFGDYQLLRPLGAGGMAEVYLAQRRRPKPVKGLIALKRLLPHFAADERFINTLRDEARIASAIDHPHVARVLDFDEAEGIHFIAMEFIDGVDLAGVLRTLKRREARLPLEVALYICAAIAEGLAAAHQLTDGRGHPLNVIHRDVSPHNILLSYDGDVKLIDFGVAKAESNFTKTKSGVIKGKLRYMSPEQAMAGHLDARSDLFSLGMVLYKTVTGRLPFMGENEFQIYDQILRKKPTPPRDIVEDLPELVDAIILKSLRKDVEKRFGDAEEMARILRIALERVAPGFDARRLAAYLRAQAPKQTIVDEGEDGDDFTSAVDPTPPPRAAGSGSRSIEARLAEAMAAPVGRPPPPLPPPPPPITQTLGQIDIEEIEPLFEEDIASARPAWRQRRVQISAGLGVALLGGLLISLAWPSAPSPRALAPVARPTWALDAGPQATRPQVAPPQDTPPPQDAAPQDAAPAQDAAPPPQDTAPPPQDAAPSAAPSPARGYLTITALPWAHVELNGARLPRHTPIIRHRVRAGAYKVTLIGPSGQRVYRSVKVRGGQNVKITHQFK
ncbi:serine/threonine protein kinase [Myxococcota bacterium]|nr:serine/threonine protein kinase [Myxococcota bacterium]